MQADGIERLRDQAVAAMAAYADTDAPGLMAVLRRSVDFAVLDVSQRKIVIDRRAILLAMLAVGTDPSHRYENTASWFSQWIEKKLSRPDLRQLCTKARTLEHRLIEAAANGGSPGPSKSIEVALIRAQEYAVLTAKRKKAALRHLFLAILEDPGHKFEIKDLNWSANAGDVADMRTSVLKRIEANPGAGEEIETWWKLLDPSMLITPPSPPPAANGGKRSAAVEPRPSPPTPEPEPRPFAGPPATPPSPAFFVSGFSADRTTDHDSDPLETEADVLALARLICHEDADPPISIGVFGGWGSGKSTFMEALQWEVANLTAPAEKAPQREEGPRFVSPVVQIRFNAWQFADADLWASLTAEFFDQLRAGGFEGGGKRIHGQLVEKVSEHVRGLGKEAADRRAAQSRADEELRAAQAEHAEAVSQKDVHVREALVSGLAKAFERNRTGLARVGLIEARSSDQLAQFIDVAKDVRTLSGRVKRIVMMLFRHWRSLLGAALIVGLLAWVAVKWTGRDLAGAIAATIGAAATLLPFILSGLKAIEAVVVETAPFADSIEEAERKGLKAVLDSEVKVREAREEAEALRAASERADRALARYVDSDATANPPRLLRYLLEDDPDTKAFEKEIGLLGRARRLFQALDQIVMENRLKQDMARQADSASAADDADAPDPDIPARIILYIDDLDRCTHEQVYKVLQAIHLLLAFELFVVVVAVDVAWIEAALAKSIEFAGSDAEDEESKEAARRQRAIEYLSKIFQLPFWLKPFSGKDDARYASYVRSLTRAAADAARAGDTGQGWKQEGDTPRASPPPPPPASPSPAGVGGWDEQTEEARSDEDGDRNEAEDPTVGTTDESASPPGPGEVARALRTLQLAKDEEDFLASPEIAALAAPDPRGVKRLVNVYKIVRSRLSEQDEAMILGDDVRPAAYPLIAICAAIETGQPLEVADNFYAELKRIADDPKSADIRTTDEIKSAIAAAVTERHGRAASAKEFLTVARIVRRYSFNRYH